MIISRTFRFVFAEKQKTTKPWQGCITCAIDKLYIVKICRTLFDIYYIVVTPGLFSKWKYRIYRKFNGEKLFIRNGESNIKNVDEMTTKVLLKFS